MNHAGIKILIEKFIKFVDESSKQSPDREKSLLALLDSLGASMASISYEFDDRDYPDPPEKNKKKLRERISSNFSEYGYYNCAEDISVKISETNIVVGDAIDDILDIYIEISKVSWRLDNTSIDDALWHYDNMYWSHWGYHLRNLQLYVFNLKNGV